VATESSPSDWMKAERKEWHLGCWEPDGCLMIREGDEIVEPGIPGVLVESAAQSEPRPKVTFNER
jgi:hypothetical protein